MLCAATAFLLMVCIIHVDSANAGFRGRNLQKVPSEERFNYFDAELIQEITKEHDGNVLISPVSIKAALIMVLEGSRGKSADEIKEVLRLLDDKEYHRKRTKLFLQNLNVMSPSITTEVANRLYIANDIKPYSEYKDALQTYYFADISQVDFRSPLKAASTINDWISGVTHGLIQKLVEPGSLPADTKLMITNAVYFKGKWKIAFDADGTTVRCFYKQNNECQKTYFMETLSYFKYGYISSLDAEAVEMLYAGDKYSMVILLPTKSSSIDKLIRDLTHSSLSETIEELQLTEILLSVPRFNITFDTELVPVLKKLGIREIFGRHANLSGIASNIETAHINQVLHSTKIEVNEEGTIAGAATGVLVVPLMGTTIPRFQADSPFLFLIRDTTTGSLLFGGRVSVPEAVMAPQSKEPLLSETKFEPDSKREETTEHFQPQATRGQADNIYATRGQLDNIYTTRRYPITRPTNITPNGKHTYQQPQSSDRDAIQFSFTGIL